MAFPSIKWHARALVLCQILVFVPVILFWVSIMEEWSIPAQIAALVPLLVLAALAPFLLFGYVVPARCPRAECRGNAYPGFPRPSDDNKLIYRCKQCARAFDTGIEYDGLGPT